MKKGDIVVVDFPYTDLTGSKLRPALILLENKFDYVICFVTSNLKIREEFDVVLTPTNANGLKQRSLLKTNKIMTIEKSIVAGKLGSISKQDSILLKSNMISLYHLK